VAKNAMQAVESRLERNPLLPKWDILIRPACRVWIFVEITLSAITAASFADLHYVVNLGAAGPYQKPVSVPPYIPPTCTTSVGPAPIFSGSTGFRGDFGTQTAPVAPGFVPV